LVDALHLDQDIAFGPASDDRWVERVAARAERHQRERERLRSWTAWLRAAGTARQRGLPSLVRALEREEMNADALEDTVERSLCQQVAEAAFVASPRLQH